MAKKLTLGNPSLSQLRENNRKASVGGAGSYANTDLAKARNANVKAKGPGIATQPRNYKGSTYHPMHGETEKNFYDRTDKMIAQDHKSAGHDFARQKGQPGAAQGGSGKDGGNPCHDSEGKFC